MSEALKPCPYPSCGSSAVSYGGPTYGCPGGWVTCETCGAEGPWANTRAEAAALWNAAPRPSDRDMNPDKVSGNPPVADRIRAVADDLTDHRWRTTLRKLADEVEGEGEECGP